MAILVTGATGFIGTNLVRHLAGRGENVRIFVRGSSDRGGLEALSLDVCVGDIRDEEAVSRTVHGCRAVFHLAGSVEVTCTSLAMMRETIVTGTDNVCRAALAAGVEKVVYTSSCVTVGYGSLDQPATEEGGTSLASLGIPYVQAKVEAEARFRDYCAQGLPGVALLPGYIFGPWDKQPKLNQLLILAAQGKLNFYFTGGLNVVAVGDVVRGHVLALQRGQCGERYILSHRNMSYRDFFSLLNRIAGFPPPRWPLPPPLLIGFGSLAELAGRIVRRPVPITAGVARLYSLHHYVDSAKATREIGYTNDDLEGSIINAYRWLHEHGDIAELPPALRGGGNTEDGIGHP